MDIFPVRVFSKRNQRNFSTKDHICMKLPSQKDIFLIKISYYGWMITFNNDIIKNTSKISIVFSNLNILIIVKQCQF